MDVLIVLPVGSGKNYSRQGTGTDQLVKRYCILKIKFKKLGNAF
jgi:hypothetical protein